MSIEASFAHPECADTGLCPVCHRGSVQALRQTRVAVYQERDELRDTLKAILGVVAGRDPLVERMCREGLEGRHNAPTR